MDMLIFLKNKGDNRMDRDTLDHYYSVLEIKKSASIQEVKSAYKNLVKKYHPDKYQGNPLSHLAEEKIKEINEKQESNYKTEYKEEYKNYNYERNDYNKNSNNQDKKNNEQYQNIKTDSKFYFFVKLYLRYAVAAFIIRKLFF
jgi:molecular chaperone DnaJ